MEQKPVKKDSHNSHNPPSQDKSKPKRTQSLRKKSERNPGGQPGHIGQTLTQKEKPDEHHDLKSSFCEACGESLPEEGQKLVSKRQVVEIPPIQPVYIEYRQFGCTCPNCLHEQKADYPPGVNALTLISYFVTIYPPVNGTRIERIERIFTDFLRQNLFESVKSIQSVFLSYSRVKGGKQLPYFNVFQYVPFRRLKQLFQDIFNLPLSEGSIDNGLKRAAATVGSDRWAAQLKTASKNKQLCLPHLQRDLVWLAEKEQSAWATYFIRLLQDALDLRKLAE